MFVAFTYRPARAPIFLGSGTSATRDPILRIVTGPGAGSSSLVRGFAGISFGAYRQFSGGVRVAAGEITGDEIPDYITAPGPGSPQPVKVFDGWPDDLREIVSFFPYSSTFTGGVYVAAGDVDGDAFADIITGAGAGGGPHVKVTSGFDGSELHSFFAYDVGFTGGVRVGASDVNGDGLADIITGAGPGGGPHVRVFDGATGASIRSFFPYGGFSGGVFVAGADVDGDGTGDIVTGAGAGGGPHVKVFHGTSSAEIRSFFPYDTGFTGGVTVGAGMVNSDRFADVVTGAGPGGGPHVKAFSGSDLSVLNSFFPYDTNFTGGVFVAAGELGFAVARDDHVELAAGTTGGLVEALENDSDPDGDFFYIDNVTQPQNGIATLDFFKSTITYRPEAGFVGMDSFEYTIVDSDGATYTATVTCSVSNVLTGTGAGEPHVYPFDGVRFFAYDASFNGGVRVGSADVDGDGRTDIVTGPGPGSPQLVKVFGRGQNEIAGFFPYSDSFTGGVYVAAGDVDGDGYADIITGAGAGGGPHVKVTSGFDGSELHSFFAYNVGFTGGVRVGASDVNGDGLADIITGAGPGGGPHVRVFDGATGASIRSFFPYGGFSGGVFVAGADVDGDGIGDIITGAGAGGGPHVTVTSGFDGSELHSFFPYDTGFTGGVTVGAGMVDLDKFADIITGAGPGGGPHVKAFGGSDLSLLNNFFPYAANFTGGVFVAGSPAMPTATDDFATTSEEIAININVLANDAPLAGYSFHVDSVTKPSNGTATIEADDSITYTPDPDFSTQDHFDYTVVDSVGRRYGATVTIDVVNVNDAPVANDDTYSTTVDTTLNEAAPGVLSNDTDADSDPLTAALVTNTVTGTLTLNSNGSLSYTPAPGFSGDVTFTYRANDGSLDSNLATATITVSAVNHVPVANNDSASTNLLNSVTISVLANDTDLDDIPLTVTITTPPTFGTATVNADNTISYEPVLTGEHTFTYRVTDADGDFSTATVTVTVSLLS